jgi:hypothetical protein
VSNPETGIPALAGICDENGVARAVVNITNNKKVVEARGSSVFSDDRNTRNTVVPNGGFFDDDLD